MFRSPVCLNPYFFFFKPVIYANIYLDEKKNPTIFCMQIDLDFKVFYMYNINGRDKQVRFPAGTSNDEVRSHLKSPTSLERMPSSS